MIHALTIELSARGDLDCGRVRIQLDRFDGDRYQWNWRVYGTRGGSELLGEGTDLRTPKHHGHSPAVAMCDLLAFLDCDGGDFAGRFPAAVEQWASLRPVHDALEMAGYELAPVNVADHI